MTKKLLFIVVLLLSMSVCANAWVGYYGCRTAGDKDATINYSPYFTFVGAMGNSSGISTAPGAIDSYGLYISANVPVVGVRTGTFAVDLPTTGYYTAYTTWGTNTSGKTNSQWNLTSATGVTTTYLDQANIANKSLWWSLGTQKFNANDAAHTKITLTNANQTTSGSLYVHSVKFEAATPDAVTNTGPADGVAAALETFGNLSWTAGANTMFFDVYFGQTSGALDLYMGDLTADTLVADIAGMIDYGQTYYWRVDAKNVDVVTQGAEWSFSTNALAVPEPGSMLALATGLIGLVGVIRRKRA